MIAKSPLIPFSLGKTIQGENQGNPQINNENPEIHFMNLTAKIRIIVK